MSDVIAFLCFLFAKIDDKKISGSLFAGYMFYCCPINLFN